MDFRTFRIQTTDGSRLHSARWRHCDSADIFLGMHRSIARDQVHAVDRKYDQHMNFYTRRISINRLPWWWNMRCLHLLDLGNVANFLMQRLNTCVYCQFNHVRIVRINTLNQSTPDVTQHDKLWGIQVRCNYVIRFFHASSWFPFRFHLLCLCFFFHLLSRACVDLFWW